MEDVLLIDFYVTGMHMRRTYMHTEILSILASFPCLRFLNQFNFNFSSRRNKGNSYIFVTDMRFSGIM